MTFTYVRQHWRMWLPWAGGGICVALAVTAFVWWWFNTHTRIEHTIDLPPQGEAAYNPLYLLREALHADDVEANARQRLQLDDIELDEADTVVLLGDPRRLREQDVAQLLAWVGRGGHLLMRLPAAPPPSQQAPGRVGLLLESLGVGWMAQPSAFCHDMQLPGDLPELMYCAPRRFTLDHDALDVAWGDADSGYAFARRPWGRGWVDVWVQLDFLTNRQLGDPARAALTRQLLAPNYRYGTIHLIYGAQLPSLWQVVLEHGRMAWLPLLLALGAWLWMRMPRFGPLHPSPAPARRALLEHVQASGEYLYRHGQAGVLQAALREAFLARLRRRDPLAAALHGEAQLAAIAARTGVAVRDVMDALHEAAPDAASFRRKAAALVEMMRGLR